MADPPPASAVDWSAMTPVILCDVFGRLKLDDLWRGAMLTCRSWRAAATADPLLFQRLDLDPFFAAAAAAAGRPDTAAWWGISFRRRVDGMLRAAAESSDGSLSVVRVRNCSDDALCFVVERSPNLKVLSVMSSPSVMDRSIMRAAVCCPLLTELDISHCYEVSYKSLEKIGQSCSNLTLLKRNFLNWLDPSEHVRVVPNEYLRLLPQDGDREAIAVSKFMPKLKHLELKFSKITKMGLVAISEGCKDLEVLDLHGCPSLRSQAIELATANMKNLKTLVRPNFFMPRITERYGHGNLYDERFSADVFRM